MKLSSSSFRLGAAALALILAGAPSSRAEEPKSQPAKKEMKAKASVPKPAPKAAPAAPAAEDTGTITNEDLERMFGKSTAAPPKEAQQGAAPQGEAYDPLKIMSEQDKNAAEKQTKIATAEKAVADAEANLKNLESRLLANKNPYLARPTLTPEEQKAVEGMDNTQRVDLNQKQIDDARA